MRHQESRIQQSCVRWFRLQYQRLAKLLFAVPNGGAHEAVTGRILKAEGVLAGVADLLLLYPCRGYHGLCIEMKTATGRQSDSQKEWQEAVTAAGYAYAVARSLEKFRTLIEEYING